VTQLKQGLLTKFALLKIRATSTICFSDYKLYCQHKIKSNYSVLFAFILPNRLGSKSYYYFEMPTPSSIIVL